MTQRPPVRRRCPICGRLLRAEAFARCSRLVVAVCRRCWQELGDDGKRERLEVERVKRAELRRRRPSMKRLPKATRELIGPRAARDGREDPDVLAALAAEYRRNGRPVPMECSGS